MSTRQQQREEYERAVALERQAAQARAAHEAGQHEAQRRQFEAAAKPPTPRQAVLGGALQAAHDQKRQQQLAFEEKKRLARQQKMGAQPNAEANVPSLPIRLAPNPNLEPGTDMRGLKAAHNMPDQAETYSQQPLEAPRGGDKYNSQTEHNLPQTNYGINRAGNERPNDRQAVANNIWAQRRENVETKNRDDQRQPFENATIDGHKQQQAAYAADLRAQMDAKNKRHGAGHGDVERAQQYYGPTGGGGVGVPATSIYDSSPSDNRKQQQAAYAADLRAQMEAKNIRNGSGYGDVERAQQYYGPTGGGGGGVPATSLYGSSPSGNRKQQQAAYAADLRAQMDAKNQRSNHGHQRASDPHQFPDSGQGAGGGGFPLDNSSVDHRRQQQAYMASELRGQMLAKQQGNGREAEFAESGGAGGILNIGSDPRSNMGRQEPGNSPDQHAKALRTKQQAMYRADLEAQMQLKQARDRPASNQTNSHAGFGAADAGFKLNALGLAVRHEGGPGDPQAHGGAGQPHDQQQQRQQQQQQPPLGPRDPHPIQQQGMYPPHGQPYEQPPPGNAAWGQQPHSNGLESRYEMGSIPVANIRSDIFFRASYSHCCTQRMVLSPPL